MDTETSPRMHQLDALRGIAACTVVFSHFSLLAPLNWIGHTPLRLFATGHEAVLLFFVLSGFVLTMQLSGHRKVGYAEFFIKRVCRIYLPYLGVFIAAYFCLMIAYQGPVGWAGNWLNGTWTGELDRTGVLDHLTFIGSYPASRLIPIIWSLIYEMRVSLIFPLIVFLVRHVRERSAIATALVLSTATLAWVMHEGVDPEMASFNGSYAMTGHYMAIFIIGSLLAFHRGRWMPWLHTGRRAQWVLALSLGLYFLSRGIFLLRRDALGVFAEDWCVTLGAVGIIAVSLTSRRIANFLMRKPVLFLGTISYSLYLTHTVVLLTVVHLFPARAQSWIAIGCAAAAIIPIATAAYFVLERPAIALGRVFGSRKLQPPAPPAAT